MPRLFRFLTLFLISAMCIAVSARTVSPSEARQIANDFFGELAPANAPLKVNGINAATDDSEPFYIFNSQTPGHGFVIISGDDRTPRLLGYSDTGTFDVDNIPPQLADLLNQYAKQIRSITAGETHPSWNTPARAPGSQDGILLETANWGQGEPYNSLTPEFDGQHAPTGCVATAMAIVMKYHNWPEGYNWSEMPVADVSADNSAEIARLMKDAGEAVHMDYGPYESGAYTYQIHNALITKFHYFPNIKEIERTEGASDWEQIIIDQLNEGHPIIYSASGVGSHSFIVDGYSDNLFHINWGWDGIANGYYSLNNLQPLDYTYDYNHAAIIDITPNHSWELHSPGYVSTYTIGFNASYTDLSETESFDFYVEQLVLPNDFVGFIALGLCDENMNLKSVLETFTFDQSTMNPIEGGIGGAHLNVGGVSVPSIKIGNNDQIRLYTKDSSQNKWLPVVGDIGFAYLHTHGNQPDFIHVTFIINEGAPIIMSKGYRKQEIISESCQANVLKGLAVSFNPAVQVDEIETKTAISINGKCEGRVLSLYDNPTGWGTPTQIYASAHLRTEDAIVESEIINLKEAISVNVTAPGTLNQILSKDDVASHKSIKITGSINNDDLFYLSRNAYFCNKIDLGETNIEEIPAELFKYAFNLTEIIMPENLKYIGEYAFCGANLKYITLPESVEYLAPGCFQSCHYLRKVIMNNPHPIDIAECGFTQSPCYERGVLYVPEQSLEAYRTTEPWCSFNQILPLDEDNLILSNIDYIIQDGLAYIPEGRNFTLFGYSEDVPNEINIGNVNVNGSDFPVTRIKPLVTNGDYENPIQSIIMSDAIEQVEIGAFMGCYGLKNIRFSNNIKRLEQYVLKGCSNLSECYLPANLESIGWNAFEDCSSVKVLTLPKTLKIIGETSGTPGITGGANYLQAFERMTSLEEIRIEDGNEVFEVIDGSLYAPDLGLLYLVPAGKTYDEIAIDDCVTSIMPSALHSVKANSIRMPETLRSIGIETFTNSEIGILQFNSPNILTDRSFNNSRIDYISIGENVKSIVDSYYPHGKTEISTSVLLNNTEPVDLSKAFNMANVQIYSSQTEINFIGDIPKHIYIPGASSTGWSQFHNTTEMWSYRINRAEGKLSVFPKIDGIVIDKVTINGTEVAADENGLYSFGRSAIRLDVTVDYTLNGRQAMTTQYSPEFNAELPDEDVFGGVAPIEKLPADTVYDVYTIEGIMLRSGVEAARLSELNAGIYILRSGSIASKIAIR